MEKRLRRDRSVGLLRIKSFLKKRPTGGKRLATLILSGKTDLSAK
jgi:hypothetical protein